jgi:hypothetical protein
MLPVADQRRPAWALLTEVAVSTLANPVELLQNSFEYRDGHHQSNDQSSDPANQFIWAEVTSAGSPLRRKNSATAACPGGVRSFRRIRFAV